MQDLSWHVGGARKQKLFCLVEVELCMLGRLWRGDKDPCEGGVCRKT